jgi:hypothetical protein
VADGRISTVVKVNGLTADTLYTARMRFLYNGSVTYSDTLQFIAVGIPTPFVFDSLGTMISSASEGNQWFLDGKPINGANQQRYVPGKSGSYTVEVTLNNCTSAMSSPVIYRTDALGVVVYPDPVTDLLYIRNTQGRFLSLQIMDLTGKILMTEKYIGLPIPVSRLAPGAYILHVADATNGQTGNLIFLKF